MLVYWRGDSAVHPSQVYVLISHTLLLSFYSRLHVSALTATHHQSFYKHRYRKNYILHKISPFTLKIYYTRVTRLNVRKI